MNPIEQLIAGFQDLVAQVPALLQPLILMAAGAVPFIEGEGAAIIGLVGGLNPVVAGLAAAAGNFLCVVLVALLTSRARTAVTSRQRVGVPAGPSDEAPEHTESVGAAPSKPASPWAGCTVTDVTPGIDLPGWSIDAMISRINAARLTLVISWLV